MICFPNAKINLGLNVTEKRPDGYHNIETIFYPLPVMDALEVVDAQEFSFIQTGISIDGPVENNLVIKAMNLLKRHYNIPELAVYLRKAIPFGAGLGGGSSDGSFMLKLLNDYCSLGITEEQLEELASSLGADCPFFIRNKPVFASGTGNLFEAVELSLKGYWFCLVKLDISVSTPQAYSLIKPGFPALSLKDIIRTPVHSWKENMVNDFERPVFNLYPVIGEIKEKLYKEGALYAAMSGSGSSVFGIFEKPVHLKHSFEDCYYHEGEFLI